MAKDRIVLLDATRGLAILGILLCNIPSFSHVDLVGLDFPERWPHPSNLGSTFVWWLTEVFFDKRFVSLFSMLFGISIYLVGGERGDPVRSPVLYRRLFWLAIFGLAHGTLIWRGDILLDYAIVGSIVMLCRSWSPRRLLTTGITILLSLSLVAIWGNLYSAIAGHFSPDVPGLAQSIASQTASFQGSFASSLAANLASWKSDFVHGLVVGLIFPGPLMLIGLGLFKLGFFSGRFKRNTYFAFVACGVVSLICMAATTTANVAAGYSQSTGFILTYFRDQLAVVVALGYAAGLALMVASPRWAILPRLIAPAGHMAFTNYLTQSLIMTAIFYGGRGLGLFGRLDRPALALIVLMVWVVQITWSHLWLRRFSTGPFEWVWRRLYRSSARRGDPAPDILPA